MRKGKTGRIAREDQRCSGGDPPILKEEIFGSRTEEKRYPKKNYG